MPIRTPSRADIAHVADLIGPYLRRTPVIEVAAADFGLSGAPLTFKLEFLQRVGVFKARGAFANLLLNREAAAEGVVAASGGNHGAAVAYAARELGLPAHIFVPSIASPAKVERIRDYGAEVHVGGATFFEAHAASEDWLATYGGLGVHAYDAFETVAGQGTLARELGEQAPHVDTVLVAVGGGGLIAGAAAHYRGDVRLIAVEPEQAPSLNRALAAGAPVDVQVSGIAADSLGARRIGAQCFALREHIHASLLVSDEAIREAQQALWDRLRVVAEPGGAAAMAALLAGAYLPAPDERVAVVLCGANTGAVSFA